MKHAERSAYYYKEISTVTIHSYDIAGENLR